MDASYRWPENYRPRLGGLCRLAFGAATHESLWNECSPVAGKTGAGPLGSGIVVVGRGSRRGGSWGRARRGCQDAKTRDKAAESGVVVEIKE